MNHELVITTTTFYRESCVRSGCAKKLVMNAVNHKIPVVMVDGGSYPAFREEVRDIGGDFLIFLNEVEHPRGVMGPGRRQAMAKGFEVTGNRLSNFIEPEKWCTADYLEEVSKPILDGTADMNVLRRRTLEAYPTAQQLAEPLGNLHFKQVTGLDLDMWMGTRVFNAAAGKHFLEYEDDHGGSWDPTHVPVLRCAAAGLRIISSTVNYIHPPEMTAEEEDSASDTYKRAAQLSNLMAATEKEARKLGLLRSLAHV